MAIRRLWLDVASAYAATLLMWFRKHLLIKIKSMWFHIKRLGRSPGVLHVYILRDGSLYHVLNITKSFYWQHSMSLLPLSSRFLLPKSPTIYSCLPLPTLAIKLPLIIMIVKIYDYFSFTWRDIETYTAIKLISRKCLNLFGYQFRKTVKMWM